MITDGEQAYRKRKYAALHAQAGKHGWDDAQYREWLQDNYSVNSATKLSNKQLGQAVGFLGGGFKAVNGGKTLRQRGGKYLGLDAKERPNMAGEGSLQLGKVEALLGEAGKSWAYGLAILKKQCKVERWDNLGAHARGFMIAGATKTALTKYLARKNNTLKHLRTLGKQARQKTKR